MKLISWLLAGLNLCATTGFAAADSYRLGLNAVKSMAGCFQVDYSYTEVESLAEDYQLDPRVYDATKRHNVKEYVLLLESSPTHMRLQRILFVEDNQGKPSFIMKHHGENWTYEKRWLYDYRGNERWEPVAIDAPQGQWTREVTSLDDGLRYQCSSAWSQSARESEWICSSFAPIPGRETRDMGRRDYNSLQRTTRIINYPWGYMERQNNVKTIHADGQLRPLAREEGKIFNIRLPDDHCAEAKSWASQRLDFWQLIREIWGEVLLGQGDFVMRTVEGQAPLYSRIGKLEAEYYDKLDNEETIELVKNKLRELILAYSH